MKKQIQRFLLFLVVLISIVDSTKAQPLYDDIYQNGIYYRLLGGNTVEVYADLLYLPSAQWGYEVVRHSYYSGDVVIPATITYNGEIYTVTGISGIAFNKCSKLTSIVIPESVTSIGDGAFSGCTSLKSITIPKSVTRINGSPFSGCTSLTSIDISSDNPNYKSVDGILFSKDGIDLINYPAGKKGTYSIPSIVTSIRSAAFSGCTGLTGIIIPESVTSIGSSVFCGCTGLTGIVIPESVTSIGSSAFAGCTGLTSIVIPESVTSIGNSAFVGCTGLTSIVIPESVTLIGNSVFSGCTGLTSITIPESVTSIGGAAFYGCTGLMNIYVEDGNPNYTSIDGILFNKNGTALEAFPAGRKYMYVVPQTVTSIRGYAFGGCIGLTTLVVPASVTSIGYGAFDGCSIKSLVLLCKLESYGYFYYDSLTTIFGSLNKESVVYAYSSELDGIKSYWSGGLKAIETVGVTPPMSLISSYWDGFSFNLNGLTPTTVTTGDGNELQPDERGIYMVSGLAPDTTCPVLVYYMQNDEEKLVLCSVGTSSESVKCNVVPLQSAIQVSVSPNISPSSTKQVTELGVLYDGVKYIQEDGLVYIPDLEINKSYTVTPYVVYDGGDCVESIPQTIQTKSVSLYLFTNTMQESVQIGFSSINCDASVNVKEKGIIWQGKEYVYDGHPIIFSNLVPNTSYGVIPYIKYNEGYQYLGSSRTFTTKSLSLAVSQLAIGPTFIHLCGSYMEGDAVVTTGFTGYDMGDKLALYGLDPVTRYTVEYYAETDKGYREATTYTFTTPSITFKTLPAKATSNTCAVICAETNLPDEEVGTGFEWRRVDAPAIVPSTNTPCAVNGGVMEGMLRNLSSNTYYQYRPYYESSAGNRYYGEWIGFGTADAYVYFMPTVHTYATVSVENNSAVLSGYALPGSDDILEQGFEYWIEGTGTRAVQDVQTVKASGQRMKVSIDGLKYNCTYTYRAYVRTAKETVYGEELSFTTPYPTGIEIVTTPVEGGLDVQVSDFSEWGRLDIRVTGTVDICRYRLLSVGGGMLASGELVADGTWQSIEIVRLPKGIYLLQVISGGQGKTVKLLRR